jgi:hypothetical protein
VNDTPAATAARGAAIERGDVDTGRFQGLASGGRSAGKNLESGSHLRLGLHRPQPFDAHGQRGSRVIWFAHGDELRDRVDAFAYLLR